MQAKKTQMPDDLRKVCAELVSHVHDGKPMPSNLQALHDWLEVPGWDELIADLDEGYAIKLGEIAEYRFRDSEVAADEDLDSVDQVTDSHRIAYARQWIQRAATGDDGDLAPTVHCFPLKDDGSREAILGVTVEVHGQAGAVPVWHGVFKNRADFLAELRACNYWLMSDLPLLDDSQLLARWIREKPRRKRK